MEQERRRTDQAPDGADGSIPSPQRLSRARSEGQAFLAAGDAAIRNALSEDPTRFLTHNRQTSAQ